jgi:transposase
MKDQKTREQFVELRARGLSFDKISKELGVSKQTLIDWSRGLQEEIGNLKAIELEALQEKYFLTKEKRIELFGEKLRAIKEELDKRDLKDVATDKLIELLLKYHRILKEESIPLELMREEEPGPIDFTEKRTWQI